MGERLNLLSEEAKRKALICIEEKERVLKDALRQAKKKKR